MSLDPQREEIRILEELERIRLESDLGSYIRESWKVIRPGIRLVEGWYLDAIADYLTAVFRGQIRRLIINQPPRTLKSTVASVQFPTWIWTTNPAWRFLFYTYAFDKLSVPMSLERRRIIQSEWYQKRWSNVFSLSTDENKQHLFSNDKSGRMEAAAQATGTGGNCVIIDDPMSSQMSYSEADRISSINMVRQGLMTRLDDQRTGSIVVVMQRLHDKDVSGDLLAEGGWTHLCLPATAEVETKIFLPASGKTMVRAKGDLLDPERLPVEVLDHLKTKDLGPRGYAGQYQQTPSPSGGDIFETRWWKWYEPSELPNMTFDELFISVDPSLKDKDSGSDAAIQLWGMMGIKRYLIARDTTKRNFPSTKAAMKVMASNYGCKNLLIEDKSNGPALTAELKDDFYIIEYDPGRLDKVARAQTCAVQVETGNVYLPINADGVYLQKTAALFPNVAMKDDIDCMSNFLNWARDRGASLGWMKHMAEEIDKEVKGVSSNDRSLVSPDVKKLHEAANEAAGLTKPSEDRKPRKYTAPPNSCKFCGAPDPFTAASGVWCRACGKRYPRELGGN